MVCRFQNLGHLSIFLRSGAVEKMAGLGLTHKKNRWVNNLIRFPLLYIGYRGCEQFCMKRHSNDTYLFVGKYSHIE